MAHRVSWLAILPAILLPMALAHITAQTPPVPAPPPMKMPDSAPTAKEPSAQEVDDLIATAFGKDSAELKRPIRMWIPGIEMALAAEKADMVHSKFAVRFSAASISSIGSENNVFRGEEIVIIVGQPVTAPTDVKKITIVAVEVHGKDSTVTLTPQGQIVAPSFGVSSGGSISSAFATTPQQPAPPTGRFTPDFNQPVNVTSFTLVPSSFGGSQTLVRFKFKIDPKASLTDLLPATPKMSAKLPLWTNEDLAKVPELTFGEPISKKLPKQKAMESTARIMAKINHLNQEQKDGFMLAMLAQRTDLRGLPFLMGDDCHTREEQAKAFGTIADQINNVLAAAKKNPNQVVGAFSQLAALSHSNTSPDLAVQERFYRARVAALMQIVMPEPEQMRVGAAKILATIPHVDATKALANLAIFSPEETVRAAAIESLKLRREKDYADVLVLGFRYPLPAVSKRAAEALVKLERKDLLANLVDVLESPDPRLPAHEKRDGKDVTVVRELVKVNHHRNCLLCHAPGNTDNTPDGILKVAVPLPGEPLTKPSEGGGYQSTPPPTPDIVVRLDMTYLRQDFSVMMPVSDAHPWPEMQRFDFLVRTRVLTPTEAQAYESCCESDEPRRLSPYHRAALYALRELTGCDTEPTAAAWRKLLKLAAR